MPAYNYKLTSFPSGAVDLELLSLEVAAAGLPFYQGGYILVTTNFFGSFVRNASLLFSSALSPAQITALDGVVAAHAYAGSTVTSGTSNLISFGNNYQVVTSVGLSTTTSAVFQTKVSLTTPRLSGTYRILWYAVCRQTRIADSVQARLENITDALTIGPIQEKEPKDTRDRFPVGGIADVSFTGSSKTFEIQYRQQRGSTAGIEDARIEIWGVG